MSYPFAALLLAGQLARRRLEEVFATTRELGCDNRSLSTVGQVAIDKKTATKPQKAARDLTSLPEFSSSLAYALRLRLGRVLTCPAFSSARIVKF